MDNNMRNRLKSVIIETLQMLFIATIIFFVSIFIGHRDINISVTLACMFIGGWTTRSLLPKEKF